MKPINKRILSVAALAVVCALVAIWMLPRMVAALPTTYRARLPQAVLQLVTTPLPTALPAPVQVATADLAALIAPATATATPTPTATSTPATTTEPLTTLPPTNTPFPTPTVTPTPIPLPAQATIDGLQILPQKFNNCGAANLTIVLNYLGQPADQLDIAAIVKPNYDDRNVSPDELRDYVNEQTPLQARVLVGGDLLLLQRLIAAGFPVIIEKGYEGSAWEGWMGHYLTLFAYDAAAETFTAMDTFLGPWDSNGRIETFATIDTYWRQFNYTFLVVYEPQDTERVAEVLGFPFADELQMWQQALAKSQNLLQQDGTDAFAWFNVGSSLVALDRLADTAVHTENAAIAFDEARRLGLPPRMLWYQFAPYEAYLAAGRPEDVLTLTEATLVSEGGQNVEETYYYRGVALLRQGDEAGARAALETAVALHPSYRLAQLALTELRGQP